MRFLGLFKLSMQLKMHYMKAGGDRVDFLKIIYKIIIKYISAVEYMVKI